MHFSLWNILQCAGTFSYFQHKLHHAWLIIVLQAEILDQYMCRPSCRVIAVHEIFVNLFILPTKHNMHMFFDVHIFCLQESGEGFKIWAGFAGSF